MIGLVDGAPTKKREQTPRVAARVPLAAQKARVLFTRAHSGHLRGVRCVSLLVSDPRNRAALQGPDVGAAALLASLRLRRE